MPGPFLPIDIAKAAKKAAADAARNVGGVARDFGGGALDVVQNVADPYRLANEVGDVIGQGQRSRSPASWVEDKFGFGGYHGNDAVRGRKLGDEARSALDNSPVPFADEVAGVAASPLTWMTAGIGPGAQSAIKGLPMAARVPLNIAAPASKSGNYFARFAAETAIGTGATVGAQEAAERTDNPLLIGAAGIGAGVLASGGVSAGMRKAKPKAAPVPDALPATVDDPVRTLIQRVGEVKPLQTQNKELLHEFRVQQMKSGMSAQAAGEAGFGSELGALRGTAERVGFTPLREGMPSEAVDSLFTTVQNAPNLRYFDSISARTALKNIMDGVVPTPSELEKLELVFPGLSKSLQDAKIIGGPGFGAEVRDLIALPQSIVSSYDLSGLRQVATTAYGHPKMVAKDWRLAFKAAGKQENYNALMRDLDSRWSAPLREQAGIVIQRGEQQLSTTERTFASRLLGKLPGYGFSQRHFSALINLTRADLFESMLKNSGYDDPSQIPADELRRWGRLVNTATGRGDPLLVDGLIVNSKVAGSPIFWAPRLVAARAQMPFELLSSSPTVRKEAARQLASFVGVNSLILGLGQKAGLWSVETDPRSADFMQAKIGNQRIDPWAGFRPIVNLVARELTGEQKSTNTGAITRSSRKDTAADFARQKFSPLTATIVNLWAGEDQVGGEYGLAQVPADLFVPLFPRDVVEAAAAGGPAEVARSSVSGIGLGTNTYGGQPLDLLRAHRSDAWRDVSGGFNIEGYGSFSDWRADQVKALASEVRKSGVSEAEAVRLAEQAVDGTQIAKVYGNIRNALEDQWATQHPEEAAAELDRESKKPERERRFNPSPGVRQFIEASR